MHKIKPSLVLALVALSGLALQQAQGQQSQQTPDEEFAALLTNIYTLQAYNNILQRQIDTQNRRMTELEASIDDVPEFERQIPPLVERMIDGLEEFIRLDMPFLAGPRAEGIARLRGIVDDTTVNPAEKLRRVLEAWEIENEYGRGFEAYEDTLEIDGVPRDVDMLRIGRVALLYQTQDLEQVGGWDPEAEQFVGLGSEHRNSIRQAIRMAQNTTAPVLVLLPIQPPEAE